MTPTLFETERLRIRKFTLNDVEFIFRLLNEPEWIRNIGDRKIRTLDDAENYIVHSFFTSYQKFGFGPFVIELKQGLNPIGMTCLIKREVFEHVDLGYALLKEFTGKGFAFEAAEATVNYAHSKVNTGPLIAISNPDNVSSIKLLNKLGFVFSKHVQLPNELESLLYFTEKIKTKKAV